MGVDQLDAEPAVVVGGQAADVGDDGSRVGTLGARADEAAELPGALGAGERDGGDLQGLAHEGDRGARADGDGRIVDAGEPLGPALGQDVGDRGVGHRAHVGAATLRPHGVDAFTHGGGVGVTERGDVGDADHLLRGVQLDPLAVVQADRVVRVEQGGIVEDPGPTGLHDQLGEGGEVTDVLDLRHDEDSERGLAS